MKKRFITSIFIVLGLGLAMVSRIWTLYLFDLLMLGLAVMGAVEVARVLERQGKYTNFIVVGTMPALLYLLTILTINFDLKWQYLVIFLLSAIIFYFLLVFAITLIMKKTTAQEMSKYEVNCSVSRYAVDKAMYSLSVLVYPTLLFMTFIFINHFYEFSFVMDSGLNSNFKMFTWFILVGVFVVTMVTDTMAYLVGSTLKGPKLCPLISPNKTISGAVGGLVGGTGAGMILYAIFRTSDTFRAELNLLNCAWWVVLLVSLFGSVISQVGDILASALKRKSRVKDYGTIFPGHGGVMDRVDGQIFNATLVFLAYTLLFLV